MTIEPHTELSSDTPRRRWEQHAQRAQHPSFAAVDGDMVIWIAEGLAAVSAPWNLQAGQSPSRHHVEQLLATDAYDAWLVYWPSRSSGLWTPAVDRAGVVAVVDGTVQLSTASAQGVRWRTVGPGESASVGGARQWLANPSDAPATTVHVYSPPLGALERRVHEGAAA